MNDFFGPTTSIEILVPKCKLLRLPIVGYLWKCLFVAYYSNKNVSKREILEIPIIVEFKNQNQSHSKSRFVSTTHSSFLPLEKLDFSHFVARCTVLQDMQFTALEEKIYFMYFLFKSMEFMVFNIAIFDGFAY